MNRRYKALEKILAAAFAIAHNPSSEHMSEVETIREGLMDLGIDWRSQSNVIAIIRLVQRLDADAYPNFLDEALNSGDGVYRP